MEANLYEIIGSLTVENIMLRKQINLLMIENQKAKEVASSNTEPA